jgi:vanillate O-demethylase ferredoxin subunit
MTTERCRVSQPLFPVRVHAIVAETSDVRLFELRGIQDAALPPFTAGAHLDVEIAPGQMRQYSLLNHQQERDRYVIAVKREGGGRGGSTHLHDVVRVADVLRVGSPRNRFALAEDAPHSVLIAGGIGITPLWSMAQRLQTLGRPWSLHYASRGREAAALLSRLEAVLEGQATPRVQLHFADQPGPRLDVGALVGSAPEGTHFYCCGPPRLLAAFAAACSALPPERVHCECFSPAQEPAIAGGFVVELARSGRTVPVRPGQTILDALAVAGIAVASSCREGVCGVCETTVLDGRPDHRDVLLSEAERDASRTMMICCSGALSERLVLDL